MKKLIFFICLFISAITAQSQVVKPDFLRTPNGYNTIVDWNFKAKTFIMPHYNKNTPPTFQDSVGAIFLNTDTTDKHIYFRYKMGTGGIIHLANSGDVSSGAWGSIIGTLSAQTDLQTALNAKQPLIFTTQALGDSSQNGASTAYVDRAVYNNSSFFVPGLLVDSGTHSNPFNIAPGAIKLHMISASGTRDSTTFLAGDSTFRTITPGIANASNGVILSGDTALWGGHLIKPLTTVTVDAGNELYIGDIVSHNGFHISRGSDSSMSVSMTSGSQTLPIYADFAANQNGIAFMEGGNGSIDKYIKIDPTPTTGKMSVNDSENLGFQNGGDYSTQIKLHPFALVQTNMLNSRIDSVMTAVGTHLSDSTIYKKDGTITDALRTVTLGANQLKFIAKSGSDSTGVAVNNSLFDALTTDGVTSSEIEAIANSAGIFTTETSTGNSANISTQNNAGLTHFNVQVVDNSTLTNTGIDIGVGTGSSPGVVVSDSRSHVGHIGDELFPLYSGKQYAQVHMVDSISKAKADSVKSTISAGGVTTFNTRSGAVSLLSADVTTALGFTPVTNARTLTINGTTLDLSANRSWTIATGLTSSNFVTQDTATGTQNSSNTTFTLSFTPVSGTIRTILNGQEMINGSDVSYSGATVTWLHHAPTSTDVIRYNYIK